MMQTSVLILNAKNEFMARRNRLSITLPTIYMLHDMSGFTLTNALHKQLHLKVFFLLRSDGKRYTFPVARLQSEQTLIPANYSWVQPQALTHGPKPAQDVITCLNARDESWGQYSWYPKVEDWLTQTLSQLGCKLIALEQWHSRSGNVLLRVSTDGPQFWFKAVNDRSWRDYAVTQALKQQHPSDRPRIFATEASWKAMLLEHVQGSSLAESTNQWTLKRGARMLADVQKRYAASSEILIRAGAIDLRASTLLEKAPSYLRYVESVIARQSKLIPARADSLHLESASLHREDPIVHHRIIPKLTMSELHEITPHVSTLCAVVASLPCSDSLFNAECNPRDVLITRKGVVLVDWGQACVSWPLAASRFLWLRLLNGQLHHASRFTLLSFVHSERWEKITGRTPIFRGVALVEAFCALIAAILYWEQHTEETLDDIEVLSRAVQLRWAIRSIFESDQNDVTS